MKQLKVFLLNVIVAIVAITVMSCEKNVDYNHSIIITTNSSDVSFRIGTNLKGSIEVNWGDGNIEKYTSGTFNMVLERENLGILPKTITITGFVTSFICDGNELTKLDVSNNNVLKRLDCIGTQLTSLDVSKNTSLDALRCGNNSLTSLNLSKNTALTILECEYNQLTSLDLSKNTVLKSLGCGYNQLTSLDLSKNTVLKGLGCNNNLLTNLDLSKNTALILLQCANNQLTSLDVSKNTVLERLHCIENQLTSLDVSKNIALEGLLCIGNQFATAALNALFATLHSNNVPSNFIQIGDNPGTETCNRSIAESKGWTVLD